MPGKTIEVRAPFDGARQSGHGVGGIPHTMREMQLEKMMVWRSDALA